jgi:hypothetical protein
MKILKTLMWIAIILLFASLVPQAELLAHHGSGLDKAAYTTFIISGCYLIGFATFYKPSWENPKLYICPRVCEEHDDCEDIECGYCVHVKPHKKTKSCKYTLCTEIKTVAEVNLKVLSN